MTDIIIIAIAVVVIGLRIAARRSKQRPARVSQPSRKPLTDWQKPLFTVMVFAKLNTKRFFRDRLALFFGILFPLIFLFVFGGLFGKSGGNVSFNVAVLNQSQNPISSKFVNIIDSSSNFKVDKT